MTAKVLSQRKMQHCEPFRAGDALFSAADVISLLRPLVSDERFAKIESVCANRTYTVTPVLERICDAGNLHAVMRSAESLGFQSLHVIEGADRLRKANRVSHGCEKWLDISRWKSTSDCIDRLRFLGYRICATSPKATQSIGEVDFTKPTALVFGNEHDGVSQELLGASDTVCRLPMTGFSESFNISVAAALSLYHVYRDRLLCQGFHGDLKPQERAILTAEFLMRSLQPHTNSLLNRLAKDRASLLSENLPAAGEAEITPLFDASERPAYRSSTSSSSPSSPAPSPAPAK